MLLFIELDSDEWELNICGIIPESKQNIDLIWQFTLFTITFVKLLAASRVTPSQEKGNHILMKNGIQTQTLDFQHVCLPNKNTSNSNLVISKFTKQLLFYVFNFLVLFLSIHAAPSPLIHKSVRSAFRFFPSLLFHAFLRFLLQQFPDILLHS